MNTYLQGSVTSLVFLIMNGADINMQDDDGNTPLHLATELGNNFSYYFM